MAPSVQRVLVVEDEADILELLVAALHRILPGAEVRQARDGVEALEQLRAAPVDLLVTDLRMPRLDGEQLLAAVAGGAGRGGRAPPRILVVTAYTEAATHERVRRLGADGVLTKPFGIDEFREAVREVLATR